MCNLRLFRFHVVFFVFSEEAGLELEKVVNSDEQRAESWAALGLCMAALGAGEAALVCQKQVVAITAAGSM